MLMPMEFENRDDAGNKLAEKLKGYKDKNAIIYALPRGGVVVGYQIALKLGSPLDIIGVRKIGHPKQPEFAIAAVTENGLILENEELTKTLDQKWYENYAKNLQKEARTQREKFLGKEMLSPEGKTAIIVDDGIATGLTMLAAIEEIKENNPQKIVVAVPVLPPNLLETIKREVDELIAVEIPEYFLGAVSGYYRSFPEISDKEVIELLKKSPK